MNLMTKPLVIVIEDIFAVVRPKGMQEWREDVIIESFQKAAASILENYELLLQNTKALKSEDPKGVEKMVSTILANIQIDIRRVYLRYEDNVTSSHIGPFILGIALKSLHIGSADENWKNAQVDGASKSDFTRKVA